MRPRKGKKGRRRERERERGVRSRPWGRILERDLLVQWATTSTKTVREENEDEEGGRPLEVVRPPISFSFLSVDPILKREAFAQFRSLFAPRRSPLE